MNYHPPKLSLQEALAFDPEIWGNGRTMDEIRHMWDRLRRVESQDNDRDRRWAETDSIIAKVRVLNDAHRELQEYHQAFLYQYLRENYSAEYEPSKETTDSTYHRGVAEDMVKPFGLTLTDRSGPNSHGYLYGLCVQKQPDHNYLHVYEKPVLYSTGVTLERGFTERFNKVAVDRLVQCCQEARAATPLKLYTPSLVAA